MLRPPTRVARAAGAALLALWLGCSRSERTIELKAPFSDDTVVGLLTARWRETGVERPAGMNGAAEREVAFTVDVDNRLADPLYVRLGDAQLIGQGGTIPTADAGVSCALAPGRTSDVLHGSAWVPAPQAAGVRDFRVRYFVLPLSERGRAFYREFLLGQRPNDAAAIDAEVQTYLNAPPCAPTQ